MDNHSTIVERLGNVIYWAGCLIAPAAGLYGCSETIQTLARANTQIDMGLALMTGFIYAAPIYLLGLATRYVLTGQGIRRKKS